MNTSIRPSTPTVGLFQQPEPTFAGKVPDPAPEPAPSAFRPTPCPAPERLAPWEGLNTTRTAAQGTRNNQATAEIGRGNP